MERRMEPIERLAELVIESRNGRGLSVVKAVESARALDAEETGEPRISRSTWEKVERGQTVQDAKYASIERLFQWPAGSTLRYLFRNGPEPRTVAPEVTVEQQPTDTGQSLTARFGQLSAEEQALVDAMIETLRRRH